MGHTQAQIAAIAILQTRHIRADLVPTATLLPEFSGMDHRQGDLLAIQRIHLLTDDRLNFVFDDLAQRQVIKDASRDLADHPRAQHQLVADNFSIVWYFPQRLEKEFGDAHGSSAFLFIG